MLTHISCWPASICYVLPDPSGPWALLRLFHLHCWNWPKFSNTWHKVQFDYFNTFQNIIMNCQLEYRAFGYFWDWNCYQMMKTVFQILNDWKLSTQVYNVGVPFMQPWFSKMHIEVKHKNAMDEFGPGPGPAWPGPGLSKAIFGVWPSMGLGRIILAQARPILQIWKLERPIGPNCGPWAKFFKAFTKNFEEFQILYIQINHIT